MLFCCNRPQTSQYHYLTFMSLTAAKLRMVNAIVIPTLMYGCEAWALQARHKGRIRATQMRVLRWIQGMSRLDRVRNLDIRSRLGQEGVADMVMRKQHEWKQRVEEMSDDRVTKMVYDGDVPRKRPRGRPRKSWRNNFNYLALHAFNDYLH